MLLFGVVKDSDVEHDVERRSPFNLCEELDAVRFNVAAMRANILYENLCSAAVFALAADRGARLPLAGGDVNNRLRGDRIPVEIQPACGDGLPPHANGSISH